MMINVKGFSVLVIFFMLLGLVPIQTAYAVPCTSNQKCCFCKYQGYNITKHMCVSNSATCSSKCPFRILIDGTRKRLALAGDAEPTSCNAFAPAL